MLLEVGVCVVAIFLIKWLSMKPFYWRERGVPHDLPLPFVGNSLGSFFDSFHGFWNKSYKRFRKSGGLYGFHNFSRLSIMVADPQVLKEMLVNKSDFFSSRGVHTNPQHDITARIVFFLSGDDWKRVRAKLTPYFSPARLRNTTTQMKPNMEEYSKQFEDAALTKSSINVNELSLKLTTDVIVNTVFGVEPDSFVNPNSFFFKLQEEIFGHVFVLKILLGTVLPWLYDLLRVTVIPANTTHKLKNFVLDVMHQRKKGVGVRPDFIQGMIELVKKEASLHNDADPHRFSEDDATSQCMAMYMGGTETTGNSISYLLNELAFHQEIQDRTRNEILKAFQQSQEGTFTYDMLQQLPYTNMVISECLRKYPIVPVITRECTKPVRVCGLEFEEGTGVMVPVMAIHWDPQFYPEPHRFDPTRFADDSLKDSFVYFPFGIGPRTCIGWKMAVVEMAYALCQLLPTYRLLPCDKAELDIKFNWKPTLNPEKGIWLNVEKL